MLYIFGQNEKLISVLPQGSFFDPIHREVLNGENVFRFSFPADQAEAQYIQEGNLVGFRDLDAYWQFFEIKRIMDQHGDGLTRTAFCEHIFYELLDDIVTDKRPSAGALAALDSMLEGTRWQVGIVDDLGAANASVYYEPVLSGVQKVANAWQGELRWRVVVTGNQITGRYVDLVVMRGTDTGKQFAYAKDILSIEREVDTSTLATALYGRGRGVETESGEGYGRRLTFADVTALDKPLGQEWVGDDEALARWGRGGRHRFDVFIDEDEEDPVKLLEKTRAELTRRKEPRVTYRLDVVSLEQLTGYEHEQVRLGDLVRVIDREFKPELVVSARVIELDRDLLTPENTKVVLGSFAPTIVQATINTQRRVSELASKPYNTKWLDGVIDVLQNSIENTQAYIWETPQGTLHLNAPTYEQATEAMLLGGGRFAIANQKDGQGGWNWRTFGDGSGFTADLLNAGKVKADLVTIGPETTFAPGYDPVDNHVYFQYSADGTTNWHDTFNPASDKYMRQKVGDDGTWSDPMRVVGEDGKDGMDGYTPIKGVDYFDGVDGQDGQPGADGKDGTSAYLWVRYSQNANGNPMTTDPTGAVYIGVATTATPTAPTSYTAYQWSLIKGQDGVPGETGADGQTSYLHIKYSDDGETFTGNNGEDVGAYIGTYVDFNPVDSMNFNDYIWNKVKGEDGQDVRKFISQPVPPYDIGDLWIGGLDGKNTMVCTTARASGGYVASDWALISEGKDPIRLDARCKALFHFDGSINDHRGITPTFTRNSAAYTSDGRKVEPGVPRFEQGKFGQAVMVEEGTTNSIVDPVFAVAASWPTRSLTTFKASGGWAQDTCVTLCEGSSGTGYCYQSQSLSDGQSGVISVYVKMSDGSEPVIGNSANQMRLLFGGYRPPVNKTYIGDGWWRLTAVITGPYSGNSGMVFYNADNTIYPIFSNIQLEKDKGYVTSFTPGTRSPETLTIPTAGVLNPQEGAVALYLYVNPAHREPSKTRRFFGHFPGPGSANRISMQHNNANFWLFTIGDANGNTHSLNIADNEVADGWRQFVMKWGAEEFAVYVDGIKKANLLNPTYLPSSVGDIITVSEYTNALLDELAIFNYAPTNEEIQSWYDAQAPFYALDLPNPNLPGYVKVESEGMKVYDSQANLRVLLGSWLENMVREYGLYTVGGRIYSALISTLEPGQTGKSIELLPNGELNVRDGAGRKALSMYGGAGNGSLEFYIDGTRQMTINASSNYGYFSNSKGFHLAASLSRYVDFFAGGGGTIEMEADYVSVSNTFNANGNCLVGGDLIVFGSYPKSAAEVTQNYGVRRFYAVESTEVLYTDQGVGQLVDGVCRIELSPELLESIEPDTQETPWLFLLTPMSDIDIYEDATERGPNYFTVRAKKGEAISGPFSWFMYATRKGFAGWRLKEIPLDDDVLTSGWEDKILEGLGDD